MRRRREVRYEVFKSFTFTLFMVFNGHVIYKESNFSGRSKFHFKEMKVDGQVKMNNLDQNGSVLCIELNSSGR